MPDPASSLPVALRSLRLLAVLSAPAAAGLAGGLGIALSVDAATLAAYGGTEGLLLACMKFAYLCLAAARFAEGLAITSGDPFSLDDDEEDPTPEAEAFWATFPNGFDVAALAAGIAWILARLGG
jgi:hypothetical protein